MEYIYIPLHGMNIGWTYLNQQWKILKSMSIWYWTKQCSSTYE